MGGDSVLKCFILMNDDEYSCIESNDMMMMNEYFLIYVCLNSSTTSRVRECMVHKSCICAYQTHLCIPNPTRKYGRKGVFFREVEYERREKKGVQ